MEIEVKSTGNIKLLDQLGDQKYWELFAGKKIKQLNGYAMLPDYQNGDLAIEVHLTQVIKPDEKILRFYNVKTDILSDTNDPGQIVFGGFLEVANEIFDNCWGFIGNIMEDKKRLGTIIIVYIEEFNICKYSIITKQTFKLVENQNSAN